MSNIDGMSATEMIAEVAGHVEKTPTNSDVISQILVWLNNAQSIMFTKSDWSELTVVNKTLTTDGSATYDLTSEITGVTDFGRLKDDSVRLNQENLQSLSKSYIDVIDPDRTDGGTTICYYLVNRTTFGLFPNSSSGDTLYLDYIKLPAKITSTTTAAQMLWLPENQYLVMNGAKWMAKERYSRANWQEDMKVWYNQIKKSVTESQPVKYNTRQIKPILF